MEILTPFLEFNGILRSRGSTKRIILHHSASDTGSAKIIHGWHLGQGWAGIGYHLVINTDGTIEQGRPLDKVGSHSGPAGNVDSIGICLIGNFQNYAPKYKQLEALIWAIKKVREVFGDIPVAGHKDVMATACPGKHFPWAWLKERLEDDEMIYKTINDVPDWGKPLVQKLIDRKSLAGDGKGNINLPESTLKTLAILEREGIIK